MRTDKTTCVSGCPLMVSRRRFLVSAGASALAAKMGLLDFASSLLGAAATPAKKPTICAAFVCPNRDKYWMGWPGAAYDIKGHQVQYTKVLTAAAKKLGITLEVIGERLHDGKAVKTFLDNLKKTPPDGLVITTMAMSHWRHVNDIANNRGKTPTVVFSPMGTSFTGHLQPTRKISGVFVGATQDVDWLTVGLRMLKTIWQMKNTRICVVRGGKVQDKSLDVIGTTLHYIPRSRFPEELKKVQESDEVRAMADYYSTEAKKIVEPNKQDILNAAKNYVVCRRIMAAEKCQGFTMDCLGLVGSRQIPCPPCIAYVRLLDENVVGACEADCDAAISLLLTGHLLGRPGFMQDPAPNTVRNTLMGAHCTCPTKLDGFDKPHEPFILRNHSESDIGVSPQVLWRKDQKITIMKFRGPGKIILGTGRVLRNIDTPPSGGCRTSLEAEVDDVADSRDVKGFHQLFMYGDHATMFKAYGQLAGITVEHI